MSSTTSTWAPDGTQKDTADWHWHRALEASGLRVVVGDEWMATEWRMPPGEPLFHAVNEHEHFYVAMVGEQPFSLTFSVGSNRTFARAGGASEADARAVLADIRKVFGVAEPEEDRISVKFWTKGGASGPRPYDRFIAAPTIEDIQLNYASSIRDEIERLASPEFRPGSGGQLLLWYGPPGTGKTWALRSLTRAWKPWCKTEYIVDPDEFFGNAAYLMGVLLDSDHYIEDGEPDDQKWRLMILEDTGELLSADAGERSGQGLSRLLNVVDGFIGQGLRTLVLITTNEDIGRLHPAVSRPGRTASKVHFGQLPAEDALVWAREHGVEVEPRPYALAELYALSGEGAVPEVLDRTVGFRAPLDFRTGKMGRKQLGRLMVE